MDVVFTRSEDEVVWEHFATEAALLTDPTSDPTTMKLASTLCCLGCILAVRGHGGHGHDAPAQGETIQQYAQRHVRWMDSPNPASKPV